MAMSTMTEPAFIALTVSAVISFGAAAPGISTDAITRSARRDSVSMASLVENTVRTRAPSWFAIRRSTSGLRSMTVTVAPIPALMSAALLPATPPPRITTSAGGTPGTPPSSTPRPPFSFSRQRAPTCGAIRPATSALGVRPVGREVQIGEQNLPLPELPALIQQRLLDFHDHLGAREDRIGTRRDLGASRHIVGVRQARADAGIGFHQDLMA